MMMKDTLKAISFLVVLSACDTPDRQNITWSFDSSVTVEQRDQIYQGFYSWYQGCEGLSFSEGEDLGWATYIVVHMSEDWPAEDAVGIGSPNDGYWEVARTFDITLWSGYHHLPSLAAHEIGHVMANTVGHVSGEGHLMSPATGRKTPDATDLEWMSEHGQDCGG